MIRVVDRMADTIASVLRWLPLLMVLTTLAVVILRYAFETGAIALQELVMYLHGLLFLVAIPYGLKQHYLELNMRLQLEQAQLAVLKRHQVVFEQALEAVRNWLEQYVNHEHTQLLNEIETLLDLELSHPLPDISGSLNALLEARRGGEQ